MSLSRKSRSKALSGLKSGPAGSLRPALNAYCIALPSSLAKEFRIKMAPGVSEVFVPASRAAEKVLKAWASGPAGNSEQADDSTIRFDASVYEPGARARALLRGVKIAEADLKEAGGAFSQEEVRVLLNGVSRQALEKRVKDGSLLAVPGPSNRRRYPAAQFTRQGVVPGLKKVRDVLPTRDPWAVLNFLVRPDERLSGRTPIDVLREGDVDLVVSAARGMGVQGG